MYLVNKIFKKYLFLFVFIFLDLLVLLLSWIFYEYSLFSVDSESNIPTFYHTFKLLLMTLCICLFIYNLKILNFFKINTIRYLIILCPIAFAFLFLAMDELGQFHENLHLHFLQFVGYPVESFSNNLAQIGFNSWAYWLIFYFPCIVFFILYLQFVTKRVLMKFTKNIFWVYVGLVSFIFVLFIEYLHTNNLNFLDSDTYKIYIHVEEFLEMFGVSIFLFFFYTLFVNSYTLINLKRFENNQLEERST